MSTPRYLTLAEAAERTGRHYETVRRWAADHEIPAVKHGRDWVILESDLEAIRSRPRKRREITAEIADAERIVSYGPATTLKDGLYVATLDTTAVDDIAAAEARLAALRPELEAADDEPAGD